MCFDPIATKQNICPINFPASTSKSNPNRCASAPLPTIHLPRDWCCRMAIPGEQQCQSSSTPPPLSINQVLALYPRERLQVHPLRWTDRQLALLGCRIHSRHDEAQSTAADEKAEAASSKSGRLAGLLAQRLSRQVCPEDLVDIVKPLLVPLHARRISFHMKYVGLRSTAHALFPTTPNVFADPAWMT